MEKDEKKISRRTSVYSHVILNYKAKELVRETIEGLEEKAKLAGVKIRDVEVATVCDKEGNIYFELRFGHYVGHGSLMNTLVSENLEGFEKKFIEWLFSVKN